MARYMIPIRLWSTVVSHERRPPPLAGGAWARCAAVIGHIGLVLQIAGEVGLAEHLYGDGHVGVPGAAELGALARVGAGPVGLEPGVGGRGRGTRRSSDRAARHPPVVDHVLRGQRQVDGRVDRHHQRVRLDRVLAVRVGVDVQLYCCATTFTWYRVLGHVLDGRQLVEGVRRRGRPGSAPARSSSRSRAGSSRAPGAGRDTRSPGRSRKRMRRVDQPAADQHEDGDGDTEHRPVDVVHGAGVGRVGC